MYLSSISTGAIFFHPGDFTPICTTELAEIQKKKTEFAKRNVKTVAFSIGSAKHHRKWVKDIKQYGKLDAFDLPIFSDPKRKTALKLGLIDPSTTDADSRPVQFRTTYIINPDRVITLTTTYPESCGRNIDEVLRVIDGLQLTAYKNVVTPVNWAKGEDVIVAFGLSDKMANETFGEGGYRIQDVPSERGKDLEKHYLRWTTDPSNDRAKRACCFW